MRINSPDIQVLDFSVLFDISTATPSVTVGNLSTHSNPGALTWVFEIYSPSGTPIYKGSFSAPDRSGNWTGSPFIQNDNFPKPNYQIEWSGNPYRVVVKVKDSTGTTYELSKSINVCRPVGNTKDSRDTYGIASARILTRCKDAQVWVEDSSNYGYQGLTGDIVSKTFKLIFPPDETGTQPAPLVYASFNSALIPITQSGDGYRYFLTSIFNYVFSDNVTVKIKYIGNESFSVHCNLDLSPIICELQKLVDQYQDDCKNSDVERTLNIVTAKLQLATNGILFPQSGLDPFKMVEEINSLTGWNCDCCPSGIQPLAAISSTGWAYELVSDGGDMAGSTEIVGNTIRIHVRDFTYVIQKDPATDTNSLTVTQSVAGRVKTVNIKLDKTILADEILNVINGSSGLQNLLNSLIVAGVSQQNITLDGRCVFQNQKLCDYTFTSVTLGGSDKVVLLGIELEGNKVLSLNVIYDQTNATAVKAALDALGIGVFAVTLTSSKLVITSLDNPNAIIGFAFRTIVAGVESADMQLVSTKDCTPGTTMPIGAFSQGLLNYVCGMIMKSIKTGAGASIKFIDAIGGAINDVSVGSDKSSLDLVMKLIDAHNSLVSVVQQTKQTDCKTIQLLFIDNGFSIVQGADVLYGTKGKSCSSISYEEIAAMLLTIVPQRQNLKDLLCNAIKACGTATCTPVSSATAAWSSGTSKITGLITNVGATKYRIGYRLYGTLVRPGPLLGVVEINATVGATTAYEFTAVPAGQFEVVIVAICASGDSAPFSVITAACDVIGAFNATIVGNNFIITWGGLPGGAAKVRIVIDYPNGGRFDQNYATGATPLSIPIPANVYGNFSITGYVVCNEAQAWFSDPTKAVVVNVLAPAACPPVTAPDISAITTTGATFTAVKPTSGTPPANYSLIIIPQDGSAPRKYTISPVGANLSWVIADLPSNKEYAWEIVSNCTTAGSGDPVIGGRFATLAGGANNSSLVNQTGVSSTKQSVMVDGVVTFASPTALANTASKPFSSQNYITVTVKATLCDAAVLGGTLLSNGITYNVTRIEGETAIFENVTITGGMVITITNAP